MKYRLGTIEIDPANFRLSDAGRTLSVEPLVFDLIVYLVENRDRLLTRQELFDQIWAGKVVSDTTLSNHIKSARKALGDDGQRQQVIKTVHGRGYQFVAQIEEVSGQGGADGTGAITHPASGSARKRWMVYAAALLLLVITGRTLFFAPGETIESIAVLPLKNLSNDPAQEYFVEGMQVALIARLSTITDLRVISKTSTTRYEATDKSIPKIARELNVDALIEGSVLRDKDKVRITAQLIRGAADEQLWAKSYDRDLVDVLTLIDEISVAIADEIEITVTQPYADDSTETRLTDLEVHELVMQGRHYFDRFEFDQSLRCYQQAVQLDAEFAGAHAGVAASYLLMGFFGEMPTTEIIPRAREAALRAIALDEDSAGGYSAIGFVQLYYDWDWESAGANLLRALELSPNDSRTRHAYADYLMVMGDLEGSLRQVEIGRLYDPFSPMANSVVDFHRILARQYDHVIEKGRGTLSDTPDLQADPSHYREALWLAGNLDASFAVYRETWGKDEALLQAMDSGYQESGYTGAIRSLADALAARTPEYRNDLALAKLYARAGDADAAIDWLERAYQRRQPQILHVKAMPAFDGLHPDPRFQDLLGRIGFPEAM